MSSAEFAPARSDYDPAQLVSSQLFALILSEAGLRTESPQEEAERRITEAAILSIEAEEYTR